MLNGGFDGMGILCVFCVYDTIGNRCFEKTLFPKINRYFKLIIKGVIMFELVFALLVKMQIELASHLKRQWCENCKENTYIKE